MQSSLRFMRATASAKMVMLLSGSMWGALVALQPHTAQAQIQRSFLNPSFEQPVFGSAGQQCYVQVNPSAVPGWETTHGSVKAGSGSCSGYTSPGKAPLIEIWTTGFQGASTATNAGKQFAELNAEQASELYQNLCLYNGETITFSFLHRGRSSSTIADVANFLIGLNTDPSPTIFGKFSTTNNGTVTTQPVAQNGATIPTVSNNNAGNGWVRYNGSVPYAGATSNRSVGFAAVSTGGGNPTIGNFLDDVQFSGKPVLEFASSSGQGAESETTPTTDPPKIRIVGLVPTGGMNIPISVSGTAVLGTDFDTTSGTSTFNLTIPAGNYDGSDATSLFTIPFTVTNNNFPQGIRVIDFTIQSSPSFFTSSTATCGGSPAINSSYTIYDDDFLSGKVWNDADNSANNTFTNINTASETGTNASGLLSAILIGSNNKVLKTTSVAADGTYTFLDVPLNQTNVKIILSTTAGIVGNTAPTPSLPPNWINTSPLTTAAFDTGTSISNRDFGIEQLPNTADLTPAAQANPGGMMSVQVPTLAGTDPEDGALGSGQRFKVVTLPTNATLTYNSAPVTAGQVIITYNPTLLKLDPIDGAITVSFTYAAIDAAGQADLTPATVTMPFTVSPVVLLVKRITAINGGTTTLNGDDLAVYKNEPSNLYDDNILDTPAPTPLDTTKWLDPSTFLIGGINGGTIKPGDELEYTIYFLSSGDSPAKNVLFCDRVPTNVTFLPTAFNSFTNQATGGLPGSDRGILWLHTGATESLTNVADEDVAQYFPPGTDPSSAYPKVNCGGANTNGAVVVNLGNLPNATAPGIPAGSYGFVRFRGKVK
jgi:uncharacterized repeat protein (TIGR01451 family)